MQFPDGENLLGVGGGQVFPDGVINGLLTARRSPSLVDEGGYADARGLAKKLLTIDSLSDLLNSVHTQKEVCFYVSPRNQNANCSQAIRILASGFSLRGTLPVLRARP